MPLPDRARARATGRPRSPRDGAPVGTLALRPGRQDVPRAPRAVRRPEGRGRPARDRRRDAAAASTRRGRSTPTGVVEVARGAKLRLGDLFRVWGQRLGTHRLLVVPLGGSRCAPTSTASAFDGPAGGDPADAGARRSCSSSAPYVPPHPIFLFPKGGSHERRSALRSASSRSCSPAAAAARPGRASRRSARRARLQARRLQAVERRSSRASRSTVSFVIRQPDGQPLTRFKRGAGAAHGRPPDPRPRRPRARSSTSTRRSAADGTIRETITFPEPGRYRLVVDVYPADRPADRTSSCSAPCGSPAPTTPKPLPAAGATSVECGGYRFAIQGTPRLKAIQAKLLTIDVTDPRGSRPTFTPCYGALAHAIFFRRGSLDYFHTHVCAPGASGCTSVLGGAQGHRHLGEAGQARRSACSSRRRARGACSSRPRSTAGGHRRRSRSTSS